MAVASHTKLEPLTSLFPKCALPERHQEDCAFPPGVRRKKADDVIVVESQPGRSETLRVSAKIKPPAQNARLQLHGTVAAVSVALQNLPQVGKKEDVDSRIRRKLLFEPQIAGL